MRRLAFVILGTALAAVASSAYAAGRPSYSKRYDACMATAVSTVDMDDCNKGELNIRDKALNTAYAGALYRLNGAAVGQFKLAERAWIAYRDADCGVYEDREEFGSFGVIEAGQCMIDRTIERTRALNAYAPSMADPGN